MCACVLALPPQRVCLARCALGRRGTAPVSRRFAPSLLRVCRLCVNVVALTDMRVLLNLIETLSKYARFPVSLKLSDRVYGRLDELFN